ncbi:hypothetical protein [Aneurinibacillus aneurinilyticus]|jgi:hypothetical protein|uniref:Uncharacterized protein n=1 Tax=Aneurinibacillus aneurinilyticus ATCC 12856 TaxID=649747 RepID=U1YI04_ANEAE|nr:hypothetical protein [Aneurinibacillus aneurinilyticus]ERI11732.1 hypothetical protein HMPREF0083_00189 [Aneurinibacillus aneurinilyticus ATCC 12856]MED0705320.1 hypothetical protein [Aneurinibacillus aneurinilyticus]MED0725903.1 hypothetical protein [Aneurinibacillus aneurinilyticus]MED0733343.1 hypothetical protein [Aneurinibacillus aneurinilyticus]MED0743724.1 hypothetical protein [Aneurinibacillus aneurinilyticus]
MARQSRRRNATIVEKEAVDKRLSEIETSLSEMERRMHEARENMNKIENMLAQLNQVKIEQPSRKARTRKRPNSEQQPHRRASPLPIPEKKHGLEPESKTLPLGLGKNGGKGFDIAGIAEMLQNPAVQGLIKKGLNSGVATKTTKQGGKVAGKAIKKDGLSDMLSGVNFTDIAKLLQHPMVQSMLKNML